MLKPPRLGEHESPNSTNYMPMGHTTPEDMVSHPSHYNKGDPVYEPYKVIKAWDCDFNIGNAIKYLARYRNKWDAIEDLEKAKQYIDFEIEALKEQNTTRPEFTKRVPPDAPHIECANDRNAEDCCHGTTTDNGSHTVDRVKEIVGELSPSAMAQKKVREIVEEARGALCRGESRVSVMRNIIGMNDAEILDVMRMSADDQCGEITKKIIRKACRF